IGTDTVADESARSMRATSTSAPASFTALPASATDSGSVVELSTRDATPSAYSLYAHHTDRGWKSLGVTSLPSVAFVHDERPFSSGQHARAAASVLPFSM